MIELIVSYIFVFIIGLMWGTGISGFVYVHRRRKHLLAVLRRDCSPSNPPLGYHRVIRKTARSASVPYKSGDECK